MRLWRIIAGESLGPPLPSSHYRARGHFTREREMRIRFVLLACMAMLMPSLAKPAGAANTDITPLFGQWTGTWFVAEEFTGNNVPYGTPPYPNAALNFTLHANDPLHDFFGTVDIQNA